MSAQVDRNTLTIVLATTLPVVGLVILFIIAYFLCGKGRRRSLLRRGVTPIADEEIESWRVDRSGEKETSVQDSPGRAASNSVGSSQKPPSVIVYQNPMQQRPRISEDYKSPTGSSPYYKRSIDLPQTPVLARAPNCRPGLTDETVQGDDAFIPNHTVKRQPSRLAKSQPPSPRHNRTESSTYSATRSYWYGQEPEQQRSPRRSADTYTRSPRYYHRPGHRRVYSTSSGPPPPLYASDDDVILSGLSPPPFPRKSEIGRAIG
ncbi:hypothetical protein B0I35DRAFT_475216 [Stachybotrys elegans]|uniref:Uncharacterized protein n=1 Tax=Stachybotrys elegans TaxID=80388 RepID=A0A8K0SZ02_9HYPO|nr:hypothetical protein B0I35DRAFT_475216 [Stachybotrys elegans]